MKHCFGSKKKIVAFTLYKIFAIGIILILITNYLFLNSSLFYSKRILLPFSLHLNKQEIFIVKGQEFKLYVNGINKRVSYSSTNFRVAGVNFNGRVFAYQTGKAFIIAKVDNKQLKCRVYVIDLNKETLDLKVGDTNRLKIKGINAFARWESSDSTIATVTMFGKVKAKKKGNVIISAKIKGKVLKCTVRVR